MQKKIILITTNKLCPSIFSVLYLNNRTDHVM